mmetsp:Transcript_15929/g.33051  ORF Transcript_15929/g.33051 Transcript_15929/m.33051 type:complete len:520 (-) Transcript_15929:644-2203(-)
MHRRRGRQDQALERLQRLLLRDARRIAQRTRQRRRLCQFQRGAQRRVGRDSPGPRFAPLQNLPNLYHPHAGAVFVAGGGSGRGNRGGRVNGSLSRLRLELANRKAAGRVHRPHRSDIAAGISAQQRRGFGERLVGRERQAVGPVQEQRVYRELAAQLGRGLRGVPAGRQGNRQRDDPRDALLLGRGERQAQVRTRRPPGHCRGPQAKRSHDQRQQRQRSLLYQRVLLGRRDLRAGRGEFQVRMHLRVLAANTPQEVPGHLQPEPGRGVGQVELQKDDRLWSHRRTRRRLGRRDHLQRAPPPGSKARRRRIQVLQGRSPDQAGFLLVDRPGMGHRIGRGFARLFAGRGHAVRSDIPHGGHHPLGGGKKAGAKELLHGPAHGAAPQRGRSDKAGARRNPLRCNCHGGPNDRAGATGKTDEQHRQGHGNLAARAVLPVVVPGDAQDARGSHGQAAVDLHEGLSVRAQGGADQARRAENHLQPEPVHTGFYRIPGIPDENGERQRGRSKIKIKRNSIVATTTN